MFLLVVWDGQSLSGYAQSSQAPCRLVLRVAGSSLAYRQTEHAPWHHLTLELHPGRLATTLPSMWHWTAALRAQSRPVARSSHTHSSINSPSFQLRNCELIRASVTTASPCWGHLCGPDTGVRARIRSAMDGLGHCVGHRWTKPTREAEDKRRLWWTEMR